MSLEQILLRARKDVMEIIPYKSARSTKHGANKPVLLNANENPYIDIDNLYFEVNRYPEPQPEDLINTLSERYKTSESNLLITRGSDEAIDLIIRAFCEYNKDSIIICPPTFGMYQIYAKTQGANVISIGLDQDNDYQLDIDKIIDKSNDDSVKAVFIPNPSAPLGHLLNKNDLVKIIEAYAGKAIVVIDEAYIEFTDQTSFSSCINQYPNLVVLRTLSKYYGLAGLRIGTAIAHKEIINILKKIISPYPLTVPTIEIAKKHLGNSSLIKENIEKILTERIRVTKEISNIGVFDKIFPSVTNFIFATSTHADRIMKATAEKNIIIRPFNSQIENSVRISIGTKDENNLLIKAIREI